MNVSVLLQYFGVWLTDIKYERYKSDEIVIGDKVTYRNLISTIAAELESDESRKKIKARYIIEGNSSTMMTRLKVKASSPYVYSVYDEGRRYIVCLDSRTCIYGRFQLDEITCQHAIAVLKSKSVTDMGPYCSDYYKSATSGKTYEVLMFSMPNKKDWNVPQDIQEEIVLLPKYKRSPGRPKKGRHKKPNETISSSTTCYGRCGYDGHNRRTCNFSPREN